MKIYAFLILSVALAGFCFAPIDASSAAKYKTISAIKCDSLIKANTKNPDFVILDVRTPAVWLSDHLEGSICRNYYDGDFTAQITALPKNKIYLLHCQSGGRSAPTFALMKNLNFAEVYEMSGGINTWKSASLKTTSILAPRLMLVSNGGIKKGTVQYGKADTLKVTLTNRANDTLKFSSVTLPEGAEFSSNFDLKRKLKGSEDYTFSVYYKPLQHSIDSVHIGIKSNGGDLALSIILKVATIQEMRPISNELKIYPNPASSFISFENYQGTTISDVSIINMNGLLVKKNSDIQANNRIDVADLPVGLYIVRITSEDKIFVRKLVLSR
jgi:rhodanese-related sulfurtransferase